MTPDLWLERKFTGEFFTGRFDHIKSIINSLELNPKNCKIVTIAGTNGKGQTARILAEYLTNSDYSYGLWTSPHLHHVNERFKFNGLDISSSALLDSFYDIESRLEQLNSELSYFEFLFINFLNLVRTLKPKVVILEVGLGGRLDATNSIDTDIAVITSISRDHQDILGHRYSEILKEKLGIMRANKPLITAFELEYLRGETRKHIVDVDSTWEDLFESKTLCLSDHFSVRNTMIADKIYELVTGSQPNKLDNVDFESKREEFQIKDSKFSFFPSHNVDGLRKLVQFLGQAKYTKYDFVLLSFSKRSLSDISAMCKILELYIPKTQILLIGFDHPKALKKELLQKISTERGIKICVDIEKTINDIITNKQNVLITGSNYFIGHFSQQFFDSDIRS